MLQDRAWASLASAHGHCGHIPDALAGLMASSHEVRRASRWQIDNHVVLQGDLYEGAPWVARALVAALRRADLPDRCLVLDLLLEFALGSDLGETITTTHGEMTVASATRTIIAAGRSCFRAEMNSGDPRAAELAAQLIDAIHDWEQERLV